MQYRAVKSIYGKLWLISYLGTGVYATGDFPLTRLESVPRTHAYKMHTRTVRHVGKDTVRCARTQPCSYLYLRERAGENLKNLHSSARFTSAGRRTDAGRSTDLRVVVDALC